MSELEAFLILLSASASCRKRLLVKKKMKEAKQIKDALKLFSDKYKMELTLYD